MSKWSKKTRSAKAGIGMVLLAPAWYIQAKHAGADSDQLFQLAKAHCEQELASEAQGEAIDDAFVQMMIESYEA